MKSARASFIGSGRFHWCVRCDRGYGELGCYGQTLNRTQRLDRDLARDLANDPNETTDLAAARPDLIERARHLFVANHTNSAEFPFPVLDH